MFECFMKFVHESDVVVSLRFESQVKESCAGEEREDVHL